MPLLSIGTFGITSMIVTVGTWYNWYLVQLVCSVWAGSRLVPLLSIGAFGTISMIGTVGTWYNWCAASGLGLD